MRRLPWALGACVGLAVVGAVFAGCGSDPDEDSPNTADSGDEGSQQQPTDASSFVDAITDGGRDPDAPTCEPESSACANSAECCTANCNTASGKCEVALGLCKPPAAACAAGNECCTFSCIGGTCSDKLCVADNQSCGNDAECCGGKCSPDGTGGGKCTPLNGGGPATSGNPCTTNTQCASNFCNNGICQNPSFCAQLTDVCSSNVDCCSGSCTKASGATLGTCTDTTAPGVPGCSPTGTVCSGAMVDGGVADGGLPPCGGSCCSRSCAPYAATGVSICQPPSGCHPTGEVCRNDSDCCGWSGSPDPKKGFVTCSKSSSTQEFGRCDNGGACREPGSICKPADYSCNAENSCCDPIGEAPNFCQSHPENCCRRDALGIPRCLIKPQDCSAPVPQGTTCATSADCCGAPCVGNKCGAANSCVPTGGECTSNADCCPGTPCVAPPGSTRGVCGGTLLPDGGVSDAGNPGSDAGTDSGTGGGCALYGQQCSGNSDCCSGVPCTNGTCHFP